MKKLFLLAAVALSCFTAMAQATNYALSSQGSTATSTFTDDANAMLAIDDNTGSRWEAPASKFAESEETDCQWLLDLGQARTFDMVEIVWEGAYSKSFTIEVSADGVDYTTVVTKTDEMLGTLIQDYKFESVTAQYVRFTNVARATQWGCSFFEFRVLDSSEIPDTGEKIAITSSMVAPMEGTSTVSINGAFDANTTGSEWQLVDNPSDATIDQVVGFTIDLGAYYDLRAINICYEGASSKDYQVLVGTDAPDTEIINVEGPGGINAFTDYRLLEDVTDVRFVKYISTRAGTGWGVKIYDFSLFGYKTGDIVDNNAPTGFTASVAGTGFASISLAMSATDDVATVITYDITCTGGGEVKTASISGAAGTTVNYSISGLKSETAYAISIVAKDTNGNATAPIELNATTTGIPAAPTYTLGDGDEVLPIYSDVYGNTNGFNWWGNNWGQHTVISEIDINGDHALLMQNTNYQGLAYPEINFEGATTLHVDVYPVDCTSLRITPIFWNAAANANFPEVPYVMGNLTPNEWNCVEIPMTVFGTNHAFINHQIKFDEGGDNTFIVDNIFYIKAGSGEVTPPVEPGDDGDQVTLDAEDWVTAGDGYAPNATYTVVYNADKTITITLSFEEEHVGLVPQIKVIDNGFAFANFANAAGTWTWTSTATYEPGDNLAFTIYAAHSGGISETRELTYTVPAPGHTVAISALGICTFAPSVDVEVPAGVQAWVLESSDNIGDDAITLSEVTGTLPAGIGVILTGEEGEYTFDPATEAASITSLLVGTTEETTLAKGEAYILGNGSHGVGFYITSGGTIAANKAYLPKTQQTKAPAIRLDFGNTSSISIVWIDDDAADSNSYNVLGQKVGNNYKGFVVKNGQKVIVK